MPSLKRKIDTILQSLTPIEKKPRTETISKVITENPSINKKIFFSFEESTRETIYTDITENPSIYKIDEETKDCNEENEKIENDCLSDKNISNKCLYDFEDKIPLLECNPMRDQEELNQNRARNQNMMETIKKYNEDNDHNLKTNIPSTSGCSGMTLLLIAGRDNFDSGALRGGRLSPDSSGSNLLSNCVLHGCGH